MFIIFKEKLIIFIFLLWIKNIKGQSPILDSRCYLDGGGSAESFLASEDLSVGSLIGKLQINGDTDLDTGDIALSLRERDSPVKIVAGTKDLILITALDKEGVRGPSSVYVNVICDRRHSTDPSFVIPVNIRVTDVNDNAPQWIGAPYSLTLSEVTVPGTRVLQGARAIDLDQPGPFSTVEYQIIEGPYSDYVSFLSPLEGTLVLKKPLDYETLRNFTVTLRAQDQGNPPKYSDTFLHVIITDADDQNPKFLRESYRGDLPVDGTTGELIISPEPIKALDQDQGLLAPLQYSIKASADSRYFFINPRSGVVSLSTPLGPADLAHTVTLIIKATQLDNADRYAFTTLTISRKESKHISDDFKFIQQKFTAKVREDLGTGSRLLSLPTNRPGRHFFYTIDDKTQSQYFTVGALGELILQKHLDYEKSIKHVFNVTASDGIVNATTEVIIDVLDVNDWEPRFRQSHYEFLLPNIENNNEPITLGKLEAADGDRNDRVSLNLRGPHSEIFTVDSRGNIWLRGERPNVTVVHLMATATDSGIPPRSTSVPVTITMEGVSIAEAHWAPGVIGAFGVVLGLFALVIIVMSMYIYKTKKPKSRNRVHSHSHSSASAANLVSHEKGIMGGGNITLGAPMNAHGGSGSSISAGASTILAASLEREAQRERERDNYTATVRSIISRATAARCGDIYDDDIERDSISNSDTAARTTWGALNVGTNEQIIEHVSGGMIAGRTKKLSWGNGEQNFGNNKTEILHSTDTLGSTENNLTVYF